MSRRSTYAKKMYILADRSLQEHREAMGSGDVGKARRASASHARLGCESLGWAWKL